MTEQKQDDQLEHSYSSSVRIRDVALKTCQSWWTIGRSGERGSGISVLAARHDDDDIYIYIYIYVCVCVCVYVCVVLGLNMNEYADTWIWWKQRRRLFTHCFMLFYALRVVSSKPHLSNPTRGCPRGVMVKAMHCGIVVREFVLQSRYYIHFRANTLGKGMNPLILPPAMGK